MKEVKLMAIQKPTTKEKHRAEAPNAIMPDFIGDRGWQYPRWPLLAAICLTPFVIVGYLSDLFQTCRLGIICQFALLPALMQALIIWLAFGMLWCISLIFGLRYLEMPRAHGRISSFVRQISNFGPVRWLLIGYGGIALLGVTIALLLGRLTPVAFSLATIVIIVAICVYFWHPRTEDEQSVQVQYWSQAGQAATPLFVLRCLFPFNHMWPNPAPPIVNNQQPPKPSA